MGRAKCALENYFFLKKAKLRKECLVSISKSHKFWNVQSSLEKPLLHQVLLIINSTLALAVILCNSQGSASSIEEPQAFPLETDAKRCYLKALPNTNWSIRWQRIRVNSVSLNFWDYSTSTDYSSTLLLWVDWRAQETKDWRNPMLFKSWLSWKLPSQNLWSSFSSNSWPHMIKRKWLLFVDDIICRNDKCLQMTSFVEKF